MFMLKFNCYFTYFLVLCNLLTLTCEVFADTNPSCRVPTKLMNECGRVPSSLPVASTASSSLKRQFPWHVALYKHRQDDAPIHTCSGTLVSETVLLTAAHCVADDANGALRDVKQYYVAAGNEYREFDDERDVYRQTRKVKSILLPKVYRGHGSSFTGDIAAVIVDQPFNLSHVVWPTCLDWNEQKFVPKSDSVGLSVGWGLTVKSREPDTELTRLPLPLVDSTTCRSAVAEEFHKYLTEDKFCGIYSNGNSICASDNGGGVVISRGEAGVFLYGVGSVGLIGGGTCDTEQRGAFTSTAPYLDHICRAITHNVHN